MNRGLPTVVATLARYTPAQIATRLIMDADARAQINTGRAFVVSIDHLGRVWIDDPTSDTTPPGDIVATITKSSCPDWIADEIQTECKRRGYK